MKKNYISKARNFVASLAITISSAAGLLAQANYQIGNGTTTTGNAPIASCYGYSYSQQIYTAAELSGTGLNNGIITKVSFFYTGGVTAFTNSNNWEIYLANSSTSVFPNTNSWVPISQFTQVYAGIVASPVAGNWFEITLTTPYIWNGVDNLVIAVRELQPNWNCTANWQSTTVGSNQVIYFRSDSAIPNPASPPTAIAVQNIRPNIQLEMAPLPECTGAPAAHTATVSSSTICVGNNLTLSADNVNFNFSGINYQWEQNIGGTWEALAGATTINYSTTSIDETSSFRLVATCTLSGLQSISNELAVTVNENPIIDLNASTFVFCPGESAVMVATGALNYSWTPSTGLSATTGDMVGANPAQPTNYTVTGTDINGCVSTATAFVSSIEASTVSSTFTPEQNCAPGTNVNITLTGAAQSISGLGTWEYQWLEADGITVALPWTASNEFNFVPSTDDVYTYLYQMRSTSCPATETNPVAVNISIGFGVESANLIHVNCNVPQGSITTVNPFGQSDFTEFFENDFSAAAGANTTLHGVAALNGGRMVITPSATGSQGGFTMLPSGTNLSGDMNVSYLMTVDLPINTFGTGGADGITWSFGDDALYTNPGGPVNGKGTKLRVSFDSAGNGSENGNAPGIYVVYGWTATNAFGPASAQVLAYTNNTALWKNQTDVPVNIFVSQNGLLTLEVNGVTVFSDIQLPQAYADADKSTWRHLFSAGTGGDANRHAIDNLNITYGSFNFGISAANAGLPVVWQNSGVFTGLAPGVYDIWMSNPADVSCNKMVGTYEILNNYPVVNLGADTTICPGTTITLDAGNPGSTYTWSNTNQFTQTIEVSQAGTYVVYITNPANCLGIGSIQVNVAEAPQAAGILAQGDGFTRLFAVINPMNAVSYDWDFGDGSTVIGGTSAQNHTYTSNGTYTVTATLHDAFGCSETVITQTVTILSTSASIDDELANALTLYPNPARDNVTVSSSDQNIDQIEVMNVSGQVVARYNVGDKFITIPTNDWQAGVYFLSVYSNDKISVMKLVVQ